MPYSVSYSDSLPKQVTFAIAFTVSVAILVAINFAAAHLTDLST